MESVSPKIFGRMTSDGDVAVLYTDTGESVICLDANVWPIGSEFGARHEHPEGITLSVADATKIGLEIE